MGILVIGASVIGAGVAVQATDAGTDPLAVLANYGAIGILLALFAIGRLHSDREVSDLRAQLAEKDELIKAFQTQLLSNTLPALTQSTRVLEAIPASETALLDELTRVRTQAETLVNRLEAAQRKTDGHEAEGG